MIYEQTSAFPKCHAISVFPGMSQSSYPFLFTSFLSQPSFSAHPRCPPPWCRRRWVILEIESILQWPYSPRGLSVLNNMTASASLAKKATQVHQLSYRSYSAFSRDRGGWGLPKHRVPSIAERHCHGSKIQLIFPGDCPVLNIQTKMILLLFLLHPSSITVFMSWSVTRFMCLPTFHKVRGHMIKI